MHIGKNLLYMHCRIASRAICNIYALCCTEHVNHIKEKKKKITFYLTKKNKNRIDVKWKGKILCPLTQLKAFLYLGRDVT